MDRIPQLSRVPTEVVAELRCIVGPANLREGEAVQALDPGEDGANLKAGIVVAPATTNEVAAVLALCNRNRVTIVPQGGRTGLVGGSVSQPGEIVLSLGRMNRIERLDPVERVAVVEAGTTLKALQKAAIRHRLEPGIDIPSRGTATIGGMVSTNAGGIMAFRNGVMRHRVFGIEAVLADGTVYSDMTRVVKNAAGYDLKHLFVGSEGTLGVVTRVAMKLEPVPKATATALFGLPSVAAVLDVIRLAMDAPVGELRAAEALWRSFRDLTAAAWSWSDPSLERTAPVFLLLSLGGRREAELRASFEAIFETALDRYPDMTGVIAMSGRQETELWRLREDTDAIYRRHPGASSFDVSLPQSEIARYVESVVARLAALDPAFEPYVFGHLADGNLHIVLDRAGPLDAKTNARVDAILYRDIVGAGGSFSAEHGIGSKRLGPMAALGDGGKLRLMVAMKRLLDPNGILNPGKVLPATS